MQRERRQSHGERVKVNRALGGARSARVTRGQVMTAPREHQSRGNSSAHLCQGPTLLAHQMREKDPGAKSFFSCWKWHVHRTVNNLEPWRKTCVEREYSCAKEFLCCKCLHNSALEDRFCAMQLQNYQFSRTKSQTYFLFASFRARGYVSVSVCRKDNHWCHLLSGILKLSSPFPCSSAVPFQQGSMPDIKVKCCTCF